ncbi:DEAD/DEAH box helicase [Leifsonia sp. NPDC056665]|uniref:DEAD/DEAH box helicase n=1 Tax=Leifsonia sp. NPDC056665 TaxID=3345901 RepID=UPI0036864C9E
MEKTSITQFAASGCEKQLRLSMHPTSGKYAAERERLNLPHRQVRPALNEITRAGDEWGHQKVHDLDAAFGGANLIGGGRKVTGGETAPGLDFAACELEEKLRSGVNPGQFLIEAEFDADTAAFRRIHNLDAIVFADVDGPLDLARVRPDVIEVVSAGVPNLSDRIVLSDGAIVAVDNRDRRMVLRVIDVKLTSEPGPNYFAELSYYVLTLAAFLEDRSLSDRFAVSAFPAVWPGSEDESLLVAATRAGQDTATKLGAFHEDLEVAPLRVFISETLRVLRTLIPRVLSTPFNDLPWTVTTGCQGCDNLGQEFNPQPGANPSDWDPRHCLPTAKREQHLSRLPFLSRGAFQILKEKGHGTVPSVAGLAPTDPSFDAHHRLRGQRQIVGARARALSGQTVPALRDNATSAAIPNFAKLRLHITADFDPGSAITLAFGLNWAWMVKGDKLTAVSSNRTRVHHTQTKTFDAEWDALAALLDDIDAVIQEASRKDPDATFQVYVWDSITLEHLSRVIGRHLPRIIGTNKLKRLAWLFPPDDVVGSAVLAATPAVSVVRDAAKALLSLDLAHTYTLLATARRFHQDDYAYSEFKVPLFWEDPFTDQIPPERAHQVWRTRRSPAAPTQTELVASLERTVKTKLWALGQVTGHLTDELRGRLTRRAPKISQLRPPEDLSGVSLLGVLLHAHAKLNGALDSLEVTQLRALPVEEQEAKFRAARITHRLTGAAEAAALQTAGLTVDPNRVVFQLAPGSIDVVAKPGDFGWTIVPEELVVKLDYPFKSFVESVGRGQLADRWAGDFWAARAKLYDVFGATVQHIDRASGLMTVDFAHYRPNHPVQRKSLIDAGLVQLDRNLVMEPVAVEFFVKKLADTVKAIKNPPLANRDPRIQHATGVTRKPQSGAPHPVQDFLWDAPNTAAAPATIPRDLGRLRTLVEGRKHSLNDSQWAAWEQALSKRLSLIWGPPGTGKTQTLRAILAALTAEPFQPLCVAVTAQTYTAVDNVLRALIPEVLTHAPHVQVRRVRSSARETPDWLPAPQMDVDSNDLVGLAGELTHGGVFLLAGPSEQLHKVVNAATGSPAGAVFDVVIIDEAGQLDVAHAVLPLAGVRPGAQVIVAGDPKQLPPIHNAEPPRDLAAVVGSIYEFFHLEHGVAQKPLLRNYRSNAEIVALGTTAGYPAQLVAEHTGRRIRYRTGCDAVSRPQHWPANLPFTDAIPTVADPGRPVVSLTYPEGVSGQWNPFEVDVVVRLVTWYALSLAQGVDGGPDDPIDWKYFWTEGVGIVTVHRAQRARIVHTLVALFATANADPATADWIAAAVDTVERFQGQERDIIIATYAVGDPDTVAEEEEFLHNLNRFNVLATRPRAKLIVIASRELIAHLSSDLETIRSSEMLKDFVDVFCAYEQPVEFVHEFDGQVKTVTVDMRWR